MSDSRGRQRRKNKRHYNESRRRQNKNHHNGYHSNSRPSYPQPGGYVAESAIPPDPAIVRAQPLNTNRPQNRGTMNAFNKLLRNLPPQATIHTSAPRGRDNRDRDNYRAAPILSQLQNSTKRSRLHRPYDNAPRKVSADFQESDEESKLMREERRRKGSWKMVGDEKDDRMKIKRLRKVRNRKFDDHWEIPYAKDAITNGEAFAGTLRITPKNPKHAYVTCEGVQQDVFIGDTRHRNRAQHGDKVVVQLFPVDEWRTIVNSDTLDLEHAVEALVAKESEDESDQDDELIEGSDPDVSDQEELIDKNEEAIAPKAVVVSIFSVKPWGYGRAVKFEDTIRRIEGHFKNGPVKSYLHSLALTNHNLNKMLVEDYCDVVMITCPFSRNAQFTLEEEDGNCLEAFRAVLKKSPRVPYILILDCPQVEKVESIARACGVPFIVTITSVAHNSNDDARSFLERFIPELLTRKNTVKGAYNIAMKVSECSGIKFVQNTSNTRNAPFAYHPVALSIEIADTRACDIGLLPMQIDCRQWGRDDDIFNILEKLKPSCKARAVFVHSVVSGMGLHSVLLVVAREAARLNRFPKGIYVLSEETLHIEIVEKLINEHFMLDEEAQKDPLNRENTALLVFPSAKHVSDEFIQAFERLLSQHPHIWALIGIRGRKRQDLELNDKLERTLFDYHELAPLDPGFAGIILWEQYQDSKDTGEIDLTEWRESPLWGCVPTLPDIIVECAKLCQSMKLSHQEMASLLTLFEHSSSEWSDLKDPPDDKVAEISQAVIDFLNDEYKFSIDMNAVREWLTALDENSVDRMYEGKNWKIVSDNFLKDSISTYYSLTPTKIEQVIKFRALCIQLRQSLPEPKYTPGSGRDPIPAPVMNESLLQLTHDISPGARQPKKKEKTEGTKPMRLAGKLREFFPDLDDSYVPQMPDPPDAGYQPNLQHLQTIPCINGPLVQPPTPIMRSVEVARKQEPLQFRRPGKTRSYDIVELMRLRRMFTDHPKGLKSFDPIIQKHDRDDKLGRVLQTMENSIFLRSELNELIDNLGTLVEGPPEFIYQDHYHSGGRSKRPKYICKLFLKVDGRRMMKESHSNASRNSAINGAMQRMCTFLKELLATETLSEVNYPPEEDLDQPANPHPNTYPDLQPVGKVVSILEKTDHNVHVGYIKPFRKNGEVQSKDRWVRFVPLDPRVSRAFFPKVSCFPEFLENPNGNHRNRFLRVKYRTWEINQQLPGCMFLEEVGKAGNLDVETEVILSISKITHRDAFPDEVEAYVQEKYGNWEIPEVERKRRRDCTNMRIFSIDPTTARDLDDALSLEELPNGNYKIGVHIADVTYFVTHGDPIDVEARKRCTSVYLVQKVISMLPRLLCENLCSLNPNVERLAYSVFFEMTGDGKVVEDGERWFGRTIIKSCCKLDYGVALRAINGEIESEKDVEEHHIPTGGYTLEDVVLDIQNFWKIAKARRAWRFDTGSLTLDKVKVTFRLNEGFEPVKWLPYRCAESNWLIEEFMLLANKIVARQLIDNIRDKAFLRRHPAPNLRQARRMLAICKARNIRIDMTTAGTLQKSLDKLPPKMRRLVETLLTKPMMSAEYVCAGTIEEEKEWRHFALNFDEYTHFTSPIRRYADIMVHRMLSDTLESEDSNFTETKATVRKVADCCNEMKMNSKAAQDRSSLLFLCLYVDKNPITVTGTVVDIGQKSFTVCIDSMGIEHRVSCNNIQKCKSCVIEGKMPDSKIQITWNNGEEESFAIFDDILLRLTAKVQTPMDLLANPVPPEDRAPQTEEKEKPETPPEQVDTNLNFDFD